jgi:hypothetical protein
MKTTIAIAVIGWLAIPQTSIARDFAVSVCGTGHIVAQREYDPLSADDALGLAHVELGMELEELLPGLSLEPTAAICSPAAIPGWTPIC